MNRVMTGIALAAAGFIATAAFATTADASTVRPTATGTSYFTNWWECQYYGNQWIAEHRIIDFSCYGTGNTNPGGPGAYMVYDY